MTAKNLFILGAVVTLGFGLPLLILPHELVDMYIVEKIEPSAVLNTVARGYGTILTGLGIALLTSLKAQPSIGRRGLIVVLIVTNILATILHVSVIFQGIENNLGWTIVLVTVIQAVWGAYLWPKENKAISEENLKAASA